MGYCPQELWLFDQLTIFEHFACWAVGYDLPEKVWKNRMEFLLHRFRFGQHLHKKVAHLSGGTKQKLNLTLALLHEPSLLVLDEPYAGFDWETYLSFWEYSSDMVKKGHSILIVSHFITDRQKFQRVYNLQNGVLV
jgi:ABC-type multidrug transport system ATPase subunit